VLPINLFDFVFVSVLIAGLLVGRRHGLSLELLPLLKWLALVLLSALAYVPIGTIVAKGGFFDPYSSNLLAYLGCALLIFLIFSRVQRRLAPRLKGSDKFGRSEYYLGMGSGFLRFGCMLMLGFALLNARAFTPDELKASDKYQEQNFGSALFPNLHTLQVAVFEHSFTGSLVRGYLGFLLIAPTNPHDAGPTSHPPQVVSHLR
jgi:uncharacterized membrane protein required for colicin V production